MVEKYGCEYNMQREDMKEKYLLGEANNFYIDGSGYENKDDWHQYEGRICRKECLKRDNYRCVLCGSEEDLNVHHLSARNIDTENNYNLDNLVTLCKFHHTDFHIKYGFGNNTPDQFEEYKRQETIETVSQNEFCESNGVE